MDADYPAAHSMDTGWFAVDELGRVASFYSGENGPVPHGQPADLYWELLEYLAPVPGLFSYRHDVYDDLVHCYTLDEVPGAHLHIDQLPPRFRSSGVQLPIHFDQTETVQPVEWHACSFWSSASGAYLCPDGVTVKPIPGREAKFAEYVRKFFAERPHEAARFRFEGPTE